MTDAIVQFVTARLDEDELLAQAAGGGVWSRSGESRIEDAGGQTVVYDEGSPSIDEAVHIARHDPARVLRDVATKRAMLAAVAKWRDPHPGRPCEKPGGPYGACELHMAATGRLEPYVLTLLASVWSGHPDYDPAWRIEP